MKPPLPLPKKLLLTSDSIHLFFGINIFFLLFPAFLRNFSPPFLYFLRALDNCLSLPHRGVGLLRAAAQEDLAEVFAVLPLDHESLLERFHNVQRFGFTYMPH